MNGSFFVCHSHIVHINCFFVLRNAIYQIVYIEGLKNSEGFGLLFMSLQLIHHNDIDFRLTEVAAAKTQLCHKMWMWNVVINDPGDRL